ncbi:hypothetical protein lerEdw1_007761 [Lerista edwardsae]|nr:hypothetical protein lerEdw1_007761 [Lerista edwardsae]
MTERTDLVMPQTMDRYEKERVSKRWLVCVASLGRLGESESQDGVEEAEEKVRCMRDGLYRWTAAQYRRDQTQCEGWRPAVEMRKKHEVLGDEVELAAESLSGALCDF